MSALLLVCAGCYRWRPVTPAEASPGMVRIHQTDGALMEATLLRRQNDTLYMRSTSGRSEAVLAVPIDAVRAVRIRAFSVRWTAACAAAVMLGALAIVEGAMNYAQTQRTKIY